VNQAQNILFFSIEDLNDWIEPLGGHPDAKTPNLTRLAKRAMVFQSAYAAAPACSPSRTATLFGQTPWETGIYANNHKWHDYYRPGSKTSLVGRLQTAGFETLGAGKVFHVTAENFDTGDWTHFEQRPLGHFPRISRLAKSKKLGRNTDFGPLPDDEEQFDDLNTDWMINQMHACSTGQFWALGLYRPHLPFVVPQRYFDMFKGEIANPPGLGMNRFDPENLATQSPLPPSGRAIADDSKFLRRLLHRHNEYQDFMRAYLASVAYADALLGRVLDHMDATNLWENTLVILWSDHGWQFGEKLAFRKFTLWERALRVPLMIAGPNIEAGQSHEPVSLIDIAPTLFSQLNQPIPAQFSGQDLSPILNGTDGKLRGTSVASWGRKFDTDSPQIALTVRSKTHRYIFYWDGNEELYDHRNDPYEHVNLIKTPGNISPAEIDRLRGELQAELEFDLAEPVSNT
jgi:arylsulfatase A-like enzyme